MKKLLSIVCCVMVLFTVSSCTKQYVNPVSNQNQTIYKDVVSTDWKPYTDLNGSKSYSVDLPVISLDPASAKYDGVIVSISYDGGKTYEQLPEVYGGTSFSYTYNGGDTAGDVSIYAQSPDGGTAFLPLDPIKVKIVLVYSGLVSN